MVLDKKIIKIAEDIKKIKIQGASNIEIAAIKGIKEFITETDYKNNFINNLKENINHLVKQRLNEPKLRNSLNYILEKAHEHELENTNKKLLDDINNYEKITKARNNSVGEIASQLIQNGSKILTHCHSSLVESALKKAYDKGIDFEVFCTETRPLYQGRITAKNLCDHGIKTTMVVDSGVSHVLKKCDYFLTGADVVLSDGSVINKIGTHMISLMANYFKTPHIILTTTHCCETNEILNVQEDVEKRNVNEVWDKENRPKSLEILNPAFDVVPNELIDKIITEVGVFSPETLHLWVTQKNLRK